MALSILLAQLSVRHEHEKKNAFMMNFVIVTSDEI